MTEQAPAHVTLILGASAGGTGRHVKMLAEGLSSQGTTVTVAGPAAAGRRFAFSAVPGVTFVPAEIGERPRAGDLTVIAGLRRLLTEPGAGRRAAAVAHAHGLRAGALTVLALLTVPAARRPGAVVTVHNAPPAGRSARLVYRLLELLVARRAGLVLCVSPDLEQRMRAAGARRVAPAVVAAPSLETAQPQNEAAPGRPLVLAAGRLAVQKGFGPLIAAAAGWRDLDPPPRLVVAGDGPLARALKAQAADRGVDAEFPGAVSDLPARLAAAAVFVLPSRWEGQPLVLQEALRAGVPVVATRVGGIPGLTGEDAAVLVPPGDTGALAGAVRAVLTDPALAARLRAAARRRAQDLPAEEDATAAAVRAYAALAPGPRLR